MRLEAFRGLLRAVKLSEAQYAAECDRKVGADAQAAEGGKAADAAPQHTRSRI